MSHFSPDGWLSEVFGQPVFRLTSRPADSQIAARQLHELARGGDAFYYAKLPTSDVQHCIALVNAGFHVIDAAITLAWRGQDVPPPPPGVVAGPVRDDQREAIPVIAATSFRWSRFHLDPRIRPGLANLIKQKWMENYVRGKRGSALYAAEVDGEVAGFLAVIESAGGHGRVAVIDLVGVAPPYQGRGVGTALLAAFIADWHDKVSELRVGTQAANVQSLSFYERSGFRIVETNYVLHAHCERGQVLR